MFERFYWDNDGTLPDQTIEWSYPYGDHAVYDGKSRLYMSSYLPFNNRYFDLALINDQPDASLSIDVWYSDEWVPAVDILDYTNNMNKSGHTHVFRC